MISFGNFEDLTETVSYMTIPSDREEDCSPLLVSILPTKTFLTGSFLFCSSQFPRATFSSLMRQELKKNMRYFRQIRSRHVICVRSIEIYQLISHSTELWPLIVASQQNNFGAIHKKSLHSKIQRDIRIIISDTRLIEISSFVLHNFNVYDSSVNCIF